MGKVWVIVLCVVMGYGAQSDDDEELLRSLASKPQGVQYIKPTLEGKKPLDYTKLFSKPTIEWKDIAKTKSGIFVGLGVNLVPVVRTDTTTPALYNGKYPASAGFNARVGYTYFSNPYAGFRLYGEYAKSTTNTEYGTNGYVRRYEIETYNAGVSIVLDTNFGQTYDHMLSVIVDLAYVPHIRFSSVWNHTSTTGLQSNGEDSFIGGNKIALGLGFGYVFRSKHRIELIFRRLTDVREGKDSLIGDDTNTNRIIFQQILSMNFGYVYVF